MTTTMKRFTVSINYPTEQKLNLLKKEIYYKSTQSEMIRDLIHKGLDSLEKDKRTTVRDKKDQSAHVND